MSSWMPIGELAALATALLWSLSAMAWTSAGRQIGTLPVSFLRLIIACALLLAYGRLVRGLWLPSDATTEQWIVLGTSGFIGFFITDLCLIKSLLLVGPRLTLLLQAMAPPFAALISRFVLGDLLTARDWLAMILTLTGVTWVVLERRENGHPHARRELILGVLLGVCAALGQASGLVLSRKGIGQYDAGAATFIRILPAMVGYLVLLTAVRAWPSVLAATRQRRPMGILALGSVVGPFAGVILCMVAVRHCQAGVAATILATMPVLILPLVAIVYRERITLRAAVGAVLSVAGVALLVL